MTVDSNGVLTRSTKGQCRNYVPNKDMPPLSVRAHDVPGLTLYECSNFQEDPEHGAENHCGGQYCAIKEMR